MVSDFEFLINYINLKFEIGDAETAMHLWLNSVDDALEELRLEEVQRLMYLIRGYPLSPISKAQVELARAEWLEKKNEYDSAIRSYETAIRIFRKFGDQNAEAMAANSLGLLYQNMGKYQQAEIQYKVAARAYRRQSNHGSLGEVLSNLGSVADAQRDWKRSLPFYNRAAKEFARGEAKRELAGVYNNMGVAFEMLDDLELAEKYYLQCVDVLDEINASISEAGWRILNNLGQLYTKQKHADKAQRSYEAAMVVANQLDANWLRSITMNNFALLFEQIGNKEEAAKYYLEALRFQTDGGEISTQAMLLNNLASILSDLQDHKQAEAYYLESLGLSREVGDLVGEARTLNNLAVLYENLGEIEQAIASYQKSSDEFAELGDHSREVTTLINLASVCSRYQRDKMGRDAFLRAWKIAKQGRLRNELAKLFQLRGDWTALIFGRFYLAIRWYQCALLVSDNDLVREEIQMRIDWVNQRMPEAEDRDVA